jgi:hypothetical protein
LAALSQRTGPAEGGRPPKGVAGHDDRDALVLSPEQTDDILGHLARPTGCLQDEIDGLPTQIGEWVAYREKVAVVDADGARALDQVGRVDQNVAATPRLRDSLQLLLSLFVEILNAEARASKRGANGGSGVEG